MKKIVIIILACLFVTGGFAETKHVKIVAVNDMHANMKDMPRFAAFVDSLRNVDPQLIVLSAGDNRTGNPYNDKYSPTAMPMVMLMNKVGFTASALGNHEFDSKMSGLRTVINESRFPYLCANVFVPDTFRTHISPYKIMCANGVKIGIIGTIQLGPLGIPDSHPDNLVGIKFKPFDEVLPRYKWMREQCDVLLVLSHNGYEADTTTANHNPYIDVIVGGHTHTLMKSNEFYNGVLVAQAKNKLAYATIFDIDVEDGKVVKKTSEIVNLATFSGANAEVQRMVDEFYTNPELSIVLAQVASPFQTIEELANMEMDALREELDCDIAIQNGGGVRYSSFPAGPFKRGDLLELDPFGNLAVVYELTGKEVEDMIIDCFDKDNKLPVYVSGITYEMVVKKASRKEDSHPVSIKIKSTGKKPFSKTAKYKVVANNYVASILTAIPRSRGKVLNAACSDYTENWLKKQQPLNYTGSKRVVLVWK